MDELRTDDPRWIGAYRLLGRLGSGGMGQVFLARSQRGRTVAVKVVRAHLAEQEEFRTRFRREVRAARKVGGRWTAPVLDAETEADVPWVATGYVPGPSLQQVVAKEYGPLPEHSVRVLAAGLTHALADIHGAGLVHRDLKPSNVMITIDGPRVIDFGIARALETVADSSLTSTGAMIGSPGFMSPEQVRGDRVTPACDIFCLGSVLAYAATGLQPFGAASSGVHAQMFRIVQEPPDLDAVPEGLRALVAACLAKEPDARPSLADVRRLLGEDGAQDADADGEPWLPGAIVARLGRHAVRLLELEAEVEAPLEAPAESAETMVLTRAKVRPGARAAEPPAGFTAGAAGEPAVAQPVAAQEPVVAQPVVAQEPAAAQPAVAQEPAVAQPVVAQAAVPPTAPLPQMTGAPGPVPGPVAAPGAPKAPGGMPAPPGPADPEPPAPRRKRWPLVAAGVALVLVAGGATAYVATRDGTDDKAGPGPTPSTKAPSTAPSGAAPTGPSTREPIPMGAGGLREMVGTWRTSFTSADNGDNTRTLTVHENGDVELSGDSASYSCFWDMKVTAPGPPVELSASKVVSGTPASSCAPGDASELSLVDSTHLQRSDLDDGKAPLTYTKVDG
ncbi:protein kinase [Streptomyces sp. NBC_00669]|uniref:serine/threonine-protein kinase n=1 Tax=Streptomyces sp. NBC_00669 TaxID=2976011 RepID=UPI002E306DF6|nr:protein kinase [Streptomyces sp. NBC_00669]